MLCTAVLMNCFLVFQQVSLHRKLFTPNKIQLGKIKTVLQVGSCRECHFSWNEALEACQPFLPCLGAPDCCFQPMYCWWSRIQQGCKQGGRERRQVKNAMQLIVQGRVQAQLFHKQQQLRWSQTAYVLQPGYTLGWALWPSMLSCLLGCPQPTSVSLVPSYSTSIYLSLTMHLDAADGSSGMSVPTTHGGDPG